MIHALPGMGADRRMYRGPWLSVAGFRPHDWVRHAGERSIAEAARSMAEACAIRDGDCLVGSSLGGIVACEISKIRHIPKLFLVGSAVNKEEVRRLFALLHPLAKHAPLEWMRVAAGMIPLELTQMFAAVDTSFVRAMCTAIFNWEGGASHETRVHRIHGKRDLLITPPAHPDLLLPGGHLIGMSHAHECAGYVARMSA